MTRLSELLVSVAIVGTATLTQPFYNLTDKAREVEAKIIISAIHMLQQPFLIENQRFASNLEELALGIPAATENYEYKVFALNETQAQVTARAKQRGARSYTGTVFLVRDNSFRSSITAAVCETEQPSQTLPSMPQVLQSSGHEIKCPSGSKQLVSQVGF